MEWVMAQSSQDLILCPCEMVDSTGKHTIGHLTNFVKQRGAWQAVASRLAASNMRNVLGMCVDHQYLGVKTPLLRTRDEFLRFLTLCNLLLQEPEAHVGVEAKLLVIALLGDVQRHPVSTYADFERGAFPRAGELKLFYLRTHGLDRFYQGAPGRTVLCPVHGSEVNSYLYALLNSIGVDDCPFIGIPLASHLGDITAWPFTPQQGQVLAVLAQVVAGQARWTKPKLKSQAKVMQPDEEADDEGLDRWDDKETQVELGASSPGGDTLVEWGGSCRVGF
jgi:hypothetical protein